MDRQLDGRFDKVQKMYGLEVFDKDILLLFSGHLHFPVCLLLRGVPHPSVSRSAITCCWYMVASRCWQNFTLSQGGGLILNKLMIFSLLINGATAVDCYQFSGLSLAGDVSALIPSTTKVYSARAEITEMNTLKGW